MISDWFHHGKRSIAVPVLAVGMALLGNGHGDVPGHDPLRAVRMMHVLVLQMYPDLPALSLKSRVSGHWRELTEGVEDLRTFSIELANPGPTTEPNRDIPRAMAPAQMTIDVTTDEDGGVLGVDVRGGYVTSPRYSAVRQTVEAHPEWPDGTITEALRNAGARYGPWNRPSLVSSLQDRLRGMEGSWGRVVHLESEFVARAPDGLQPRPVLAWRANVTMQAGNRVHRYVMLLEPFEGRLTSLTRRDPR
jgi:hypothetical protein